MADFARYTCTDRQAELVHKLISSHSVALKNWMASAIERRDYARADELVSELREYEVLYAKFNVKAHREMEAAKAAAEG